MASFPPRQQVMLDVVSRLSPQVDRLSIVLNEYQDIPKELAVFQNVEPILLDEDLKDIGKFYPNVAEGDFVALVDDDLGYPKDYIGRAIDLADEAGWDGNVFGYMGLAWVFKKRLQRKDWRVHNFKNETKQILGVDVLGTGVSFVRGQDYPPINYMKSAKGFADIRFARWIVENNLRGWVLPKPKNYITSILPDELYSGSLFESFGRKTIGQLSGAARDAKLVANADIRQVIGKNGHVNKRHASFMRQLAQGKI